MIFALLLLFATAFANIEDHYKTMVFKNGSRPPKGIDYLYVINLDQRAERWTRSLERLAPYHLMPDRFSAIYGWNLTPAVLNEMGMKFQHGMWTGREYVMMFPPDLNGKWQFVSLNGSHYGRACFSGWTVKGTIGCTLSHLSVMQDAYESGFETIWILEDDFSIVKDPHLLSGLIEELDALVGPEGWDVLYTDSDYFSTNPSKPLADQLPHMWRPDMPYLDITFLGEAQEVGEKFKKIGSRGRAHSMIYRRCGLKKILDFYRTRGNFLPYDQELALIPGIKTFVVKDPIVTAWETDTDTRYRHFE